MKEGQQPEHQKSWGREWRTMQPHSLAGLPFAIAIEKNVIISNQLSRLQFVLVINHHRSYSGGETASPCKNREC